MRNFSLSCHDDDDTYTILTSDYVQVIRFISFLNFKDRGDYCDPVHVDIDLLEECKK